MGALPVCLVPEGCLWALICPLIRPAPTGEQSSPAKLWTTDTHNVEFDSWTHTHTSTRSQYTPCSMFETMETSKNPTVGRVVLRILANTKSM